MARRNPRGALWYALRSRELSNVTYELANEGELGRMAARVLDRDPAEVAGYLDELRSDHAWLAGLSEALGRSREHDAEARLGKRRLLYVMVRAERPEVIAEAGVDAGLGSAVLLRALERNEAEGSPGRLISFDVDPGAGWLVDTDRHRERFLLQLGDTRQTLEPALRTTGVDLFIHDSLQTHEHESFELEAAIRHRRGDRLVLYTDDASVTGALRETCERHGGRCETLWERPLRHYWRGNLLGVCLLER